MSEKKFTHAHALVGMFIEMTAADGKIDKIELQTVGGLVHAILEPAGFDEETRKQTINEGFDWWDSFNNTEERIQAVFKVASGIGEALEKDIRIKAARGLMIIGQADGEIADIESKFLHACLECLNITFDEAVKKQ